MLGTTKPRPSTLPENVGLNLVDAFNIARASKEFLFFFIYQIKSNTFISFFYSYSLISEEEDHPRDVLTQILIDVQKKPVIKIKYFLNII